MFGSDEVSKTYTNTFQFTSNYAKEGLKLEEKSKFTETKLDNGQVMYCSPGHCFIDGPIEPLLSDEIIANGVTLGLNIWALKGLIGGIKTAGDISENIVNSEQYKNTQNNIEIKYNKHVENQMVSRGWNKSTIEETIQSPLKKFETVDSRNNPTTGVKNNEPATLYQAKDGSYVIKNNKNGDIVQISDKSDPNWQWPKNIKEIK